ncbi:VOC family protein [Micrococcales bacterium 31B]|nr:VOC family protein [Micrococcales bacterium 31B]
MTAEFTMVELPSCDAAASAEFMAKAFNLHNTMYGHHYADVHFAEDISLAFQSDPAERPAAPLAVFEVADLAAAREAIIEAGGEITVEEFAFPGGRRLQFREPGGNELGVWVPSEG